MFYNLTMKVFIFLNIFPVEVWELLWDGDRINGKV